MKTTKKLVLLLALFGILIGACTFRAVRGSGNVITETVAVSGFDRVALSGMGEVIVSQGEGESLRIETDDNIMDLLDIKVENDRLILGFEQGVNVTSVTRLVFYVGIDEVRELSVSGSGDIEADRIEADSLDLAISGSGGVMITDLSVADIRAEISGSGEIQLDGEASSQDITISGSGKYLAGDLCVDQVDIEVSGSGDATICVLDRLDVGISGSGSVNYYGQPAIDFSASGSGDLNSLGNR